MVLSNGCFMVRACLTLAAVALLTLATGLCVLTIGLILPARWCFEPLFRLWGRGILAAAGVRFVVSGPERESRDPPCFYVGNHQSALDIPCVVAATRGRVRFMAKHTLFRIPVFGWIMLCHNFVSIDRRHARRAKAALDSMLDGLRRKPVPIAVFPEGTRSADGHIQPFRRGAIRMCRDSGQDIVPFAISGSREVHVRGEFRIRPGTVHLRFGRAIPASAAASSDSNDLQQLLCDTVRELHGRITATPPPSESAKMRLAAEGDVS